jgi:hypothetical protein
VICYMYCLVMFDLFAIRHATMCLHMYSFLNFIGICRILYCMIYWWISYSNYTLIQILLKLDVTEVQFIRYVWKIASNRIIYFPSRQFLSYFTKLCLSHGTYLGTIKLSFSFNCERTSKTNKSALQKLYEAKTYLFILYVRSILS